MATRAGQVLARELDLYNEFWAIAREGEPVQEFNPLGRFVVLENTPGYLPENDEPPTFETFKEAWTYLAEEVQRYVEHLMEVDLTADVQSDPEFGWATVDDGGLGRNFYINSTEEDCDD
jgi:hypothetical protein